jgi:hypothetical protein
MPIVKRTYRHWLGRRAFVGLSIANELWYDVLSGGARSYHLVRLSWLQSPRFPGAKLVCLTLPFISLHLGVRTRRAGIASGEFHVPEGANINSVCRSGNHGITIGFSSSAAAARFEQAMREATSADRIPETDSLVFIGMTDYQRVTVGFGSTLAAREFEQAARAASPHASPIDTTKGS